MTTIKLPKQFDMGEALNDLKFSLENSFDYIEASKTRYHEGDRKKNELLQQIVVSLKVIAIIEKGLNK